MAGKRYPADETGKKRRLIRQLDWLEIGKIAKLVGALRKRANSSTNLELAKAIGIEADYFEGNQDRMRYSEFVNTNFSLAPASLKPAAKP